MSSFLFLALAGLSWHARKAVQAASSSANAARALPDVYRQVCKCASSGGGGKLTLRSVSFLAFFSATVSALRRGGRAEWATGPTDFCAGAASMTVTTLLEKARMLTCIWEGLERR